MELIPISVKGHLHVADKWNDFVSIISVESSWEQSLKTKMTNLASLVQFIRNHVSAVGDIEQIVSRNNCESRANLNQRSEQLSLQIITFSTMTQCSSRLCSVLFSHPPPPPPFSFRLWPTSSLAENLANWNRVHYQDANHV